MKSKKEVLQEESKKEEAKLAVFHPSVDFSLRGVLHFSETFLRKQEERTQPVLKAIEKREKKMEIKKKEEEEKEPELVALGATELFRIVITDNGEQREYMVYYRTSPKGKKSVSCVNEGQACFVEGLFCTAPIADYEQIKERLAEHLGVPTEELLS